MCAGNLYVEDKSMTKNHGSQIKDDEQYEALRDKGFSKEKAARISNAQMAESQMIRRQSQDINNLLNHQNSSGA